jgi:uncharacterized protein YqeY
MERSQNKTELRAYRNLKAEFLKAETAKNAKPIDEVRQIQIIKKYCETLEKSILDFSEARREDLVADYRDELEVLKKLLPEPVDESQICFELGEWAESHNFGFVLSIDNPIRIPKKEMGNAIKHLKSKFPQADGKMISNIVKEYII